MKQTGRRKLNRKRLKSLVIILAAIIIFVTSYSLILPAITMEVSVAQEEAGIVLHEQEDDLSVSETDREEACEASEMQAADAAEPDMPTADEDLSSDAGASDSETAAAEETNGADNDTATDAEAKKEAADAQTEAEAADAAGLSADEEKQEMPALTFTAEIKKGKTRAKAAGLTDSEQQAAEKKANDTEAAANPETGKKIILAKVVAEAKADTFPAGTTMEIEEVSADEAVLDAIAAVFADEVKQVQAVDITFYDNNGKKIEPAQEIKVTITSEAIKQAEDPVIVHIPDQGDAELVECIDEKKLEEKPAEDEVIFEADQFSVYAIIGTVIEKNILASDGQNYKVTVMYGDETRIPADAQLEVEEILPDGQDESHDSEDGNGDAGTSSAYDEYVSKTENALGMEEGRSGYIRLFDIKIVDKDDHSVKYQPAKGSTVDVRIELADAQSDELNVVHFADGSKDGDVVDISSGICEEGSSVEFQADGFSVYSVVDISEPEGQEEVTVKSLADLEGRGFYIDNTLNDSPRQWFLTGTFNTDGKFAASTSRELAALFYFECASTTSDTSGEYYIYYYNTDSEKKYFSATGSLGDWIFQLVDSKDSAIPFTVTVKGDNMITINKQESWNHSFGNFGNTYYFHTAHPTDKRHVLNLTCYQEPLEDPYALNNKSYGIVYNHDSINALALMSDDTSINSREVLIRPDVLNHQGTLLVSPDSNISKWTFTCVGGDVYTIQDENGKYLSISSSGVTLKGTADDTCKIKITAGSDAYAGKIRLSSGGYALSAKYEWDNNKGYAFNGFKVSQTEDAETWFNLADDTVLKDDDFYSYSAEKISASDEILSATQKDENGEIQKDESGNPAYKSEKANVIVYTRVWNDTTKSYEYYAVDHDGTLVRVYESGDRINWVGSSINTMLWEFTEYTYGDGTPNYYYELRNTVYNNYLAPQLMSNQIIFDETVGINLNGRRYGQDYTSIIAWDEEAYSFSGLKVENGKVVPCALSEADDFYFAYMHEEEGEQDKLTTVETVNNNEYGITMKMQNYPYQNYYISGTSNSVVQDASGGYRSKTQADVLGYDNTASPNGTGEGLLSTDLKENGYPDTTYLNNREAKNKSLQQLYNDAQIVNHLFLQSTYNETGYFEYDSTQNFAQLNKTTGDFTVYEQLAAGEVLYSRAFHSHGMFLPYNDITKAKISEELYNLTDMSAHELPDSDPRKGEGLYTFDSSYPGATGTLKDGATEYFFGMELEASFTQTPNGLDAWGHDIIFEFSGDDDFWLYVDGELIADLGGVRGGSGANGGAQSAKVNFSTGEVIINNNITTLYELFKSHYDARVKAGTMTQEKETQKLEETFIQKGDNYIFKDYSNHTMKIFYMERGGGASNLHMKFNLAAVKPGTVELSKKLSGSDSESNSLIEFPYQIYYRQQADGGETYKLLTPTDGKVTYKDSITNVTYQDTLSIDGANYQSVYMLKPGETAVISLPEKTIDYYIVECGVNTDAYDKVSANGTELTGRNDTQPQNSEASAVSGTRQNFSTIAATTADRPQVEYDNHVAKGAMRTLTISKKLYDADGKTILSYDAAKEELKNETLFDFRLYLGNEYSDELSGANLYSYFVKNSKGEYCRWDRSVKKFAAILSTDNSPITEYSALSTYLASLTQAEQETIIFKTSMNGAIARIPAGYSVEVRDLVIGTKWRVEERDNEIPKGYTRRESDGYTRLDTNPAHSQSTPVGDTMKNGDEPKVEIRNQKGWGLTVEKVWTDKDFMESHDVIYFAVYLNDPKDANADNDTLIDGTVHQLKNGETEIYYFFDDLRAGTKNTTYTFDQFVVREVTLTKGEDFQVNSETGVVTGYSGVTPIYDNGTLNIGGKAFSGEYQEAGDNGFKYTVSYDVGIPTGRNENIRTDTVTNSRPGIKLYKSSWTGAWNDGILTGALAGATFTLKDSEGSNVAAAAYTSSDDGLITIAYLNPGTYTLTETETPNGYVRLDSPVSITVAENGSVSVSGLDAGYYILNTTSDSSMSAVITIRNRTTELLAKKVDAENRETALENVHFTLYSQVKDADGNLRKDLLPITGYEDLVTDANGIIQKITMDLGAGTYYLTEKQAISGYVLLSEDICFTIGRDGTVTVNNSADTGTVISRTEDASRGETSYVMTIPNYKWGMILKKVDEQSRALSGAKFNLCQLNESSIWVNVEGYANIDMTSTSVTTLSNLTNGRYKLTETAAPAGYVICEKAIYFEVNNGAIRLTNENGDDLTGESMASLSTETDSNRNTVYVLTVTNTPGVALPSTGGPGTLAFTILGSILVAGAGVLLWRRRSRS